MTMDMTVEKSQSAPKRSFDVAFLTGTVEKKASKREETDQCDVIDVTDVTDATDVGLPDGGSSKSAFKKVSKTPPVGTSCSSTPSSSSSSSSISSSSTTTTSSSNNSSSSSSSNNTGATLNDAVMPYPFSLPAIATTLSLQLLQQNSAKGLAMSLFNPSMFPASKSYGGLLAPGRVDSAALIEDYLRAQASIYQQQEKELSMFSMLKTRSASTDGSASLAAGSYSLAGGVNPESRTPRTPVMMPPAPVMAPPMMGGAAIGTPSQNVCAKCNLSFRMTSDLVYHMRSQHRRESDPVRQKRQEKLRCPVCGENFRERHHLTRHMTSHDDRELEVIK